MPLTSNITPWRGSASEGDEEALLDFDLEALLDLGPEVDCFLQGPAESFGEEDRKMSSPEPPVEDLESWVTWRAQLHDMPNWWQELTEVPGVDDHKRMAQEVQASFELPQQISKWHHVENYHQAPLAPLCIHQKNFLLLHDSKFACQDIRELQWRDGGLCLSPPVLGEKKAIPTTHGQPCLLVGSIVELREEMKCWLSQRNPQSPNQRKWPLRVSAQPTQTDSPVKEAAVKVTEEPSKKEKPPN